LLDSTDRRPAFDRKFAGLSDEERIVVMHAPEAQRDDLATARTRRRR